MLDITSVLPEFKLQENVGSDRSWVWSCPADYSEEKPTEEVFAIRFANSESMFCFHSVVTISYLSLFWIIISVLFTINSFFFSLRSDAKAFKTKFEDCQKVAKALATSGTDAAEELQKELFKLSVSDKNEEKSDNNNKEEKKSEKKEEKSEENKTEQKEQK